MFCIERSVDVWEATNTLAYFVYAQAIGRPDSRTMRQSCQGSGPRRTTQYFLPTQGRSPRAHRKTPALSHQPSPPTGEAGGLVRLRVFLWQPLPQVIAG